MYRLAVIGILILAFILRVPALNQYPLGFTPDEASFGYDAYSILLTGKDQWGERFPLVLKSFGDYKPPLYSYISIPFVSVMGLNRVSVRLPNALFGVMAVFATLLLAGEIGRRLKLSKSQIRLFQLFSSLLLAISPWHVMMSRGAFEANLTTFILPMAIYLFLRSTRNNKLLICSALLFGLNLFSYHSARLVTPGVLVVLIFLFFKDLRLYNKKFLAASAGIFLTFVLLLVYSFSKGSGARLQERFIGQGAAQEAAVNRLIALESGEDFFVAKVLHNKYTVTLKRFVSNYTQYTSYNFLYINGPAEGTYGMIPGMGVSYWFTFPLLIFFIYFFLKNPNQKVLLILLSWIFLAPVPAALASGSGYSANRAVIMLPALQIICGIGLISMLEFLRKWLKERYIKAVIYALSIVIAISFINFIEKYFILSPYLISQNMLYGNLEAAYVTSTQTQGNVAVSKKLSEPHIYFAFVERTPPDEYHKFSSEWDMEKHNVDWVDQIPEYQLGRYTFKNIQWGEDSVIYPWIVGRDDDLPDSITPDLVIQYPNKEPSVLIVKPNLDNYAYKNY